MKVSRELRPIETPFPQRVADFRRRWVPVLVWSVAALACVWMLSGRARGLEYLGIARALQFEVSADSVGQLDALLVDLYDRVEAGDIVAKLDDAEVSARVERGGKEEDIPLSRLGEADDIAAAVCFLASDNAAYITGQTLHVNGGMYVN